MSGQFESEITIGLWRVVTAISLSGLGLAHMETTTTKPLGQYFAVTFAALPSISKIPLLD